MGEDCDVAGVPVNTGSGAYHEQDRPRAGIGAPMKLSSSDTPFAAGFRMPPEWEKHERTWISFPFDDERGAGRVAEVREEVGRRIAFVSRFEPVRVNIAEEGDSDVVLHAVEEHGGILENVPFLRLPLDDAWFRDNGPLFIRDGEGRVAMTDRSEEHTSELQSRGHLVCRLLLEKKKYNE